MPITPEYAEQLKQLHAKSKRFGNRTMHPSAVLGILERLRPRTMIDYGHGKADWYMACALPQELEELHFYDPGYAFNPDIKAHLEAHGKRVFVHEDEDTLLPAEFVSCRHVLEHVEPKYLQDTWRKLLSLTGKMLFVEIGLGPAIAVLPDGRNAHLCQYPPQEWGIMALAASLDDKQIVSTAMHFIPDRAMTVILGRQ